MRMLVTGASGLLGLNLALEAAGSHEVYGVVNRNKVQDRYFEVLTGDLLMPGVVESIYEQAKPEWVIHCAAQANLDACEADPSLAHRVNTELAGLMARQAAKRGAGFIHISTDAIFDGKRGDYIEQDAPCPLSVYGKTKMEAERVVAEANPNAIIARVVFYGWSLTGTRSLAEFFFNNLTEGHPALGFKDTFFCPLLVNDLSHILFKMMDAGLSGLFHVAGSECLSKYNFGIALARQFGLDETLITPSFLAEADLHAARAPILSLNTEKLEAALGFTPPNAASGIERFYALYTRGHPQMLQGLQEPSAG
jgi:dTDP-4-dehydrorhamnose reductase